MKNHHANVRSDQKQNLKMVNQGKKTFLCTQTILMLKVYVR